MKATLAQYLLVSPVYMSTVSERSSMGRNIIATFSAGNITQDRKKILKFSLPMLIRSHQIFTQRKPIHP